MLWQWTPWQRADARVKRAEKKRRGVDRSPALAGVLRVLRAQWGAS